MKKKKSSEDSQAKYVVPIIIMVILALIFGESWCRSQSNTDDSSPIDYEKVSYDFQLALSEIDQLREGLGQRAELEPVRTVSEYDLKVQNELRRLEKYLNQDSLGLFFTKHSDLESKFSGFRGTEINDSNRGEIENILNDFLRLNTQIYNYLEEEYLKYRRNDQSN